MQKSSLFKKHSISLIAIFIIGNTLIYFPNKLDIKSSSLGLILSITLSIPLFLLFYKINKKCLSTNILEEIKYNSNKLYKIILCAIFLISAFLIALPCLSEYVSYVNRFRMPLTYKIIISVIFMALVIYIAYSKKSAIYKLSIICFIYVLLSSVILFILSFNHFDFSNLLPVEFKGKDVLSSIIILIAKSFATIILLSLFFKNEKDKPRSIYLMGLFLGGIILFICVLNVLLIFGSKITEELSLPYANAMSVISLGDVFTRLEGFSYLNYFACSIIKTATCLFIIKTIAYEFFEKKANYIVFLFSLISIILTLFDKLPEIFYSLPFNIVLILFEAALIIALSLYKKQVKK